MAVKAHTFVRMLVAILVNGFERFVFELADNLFVDVHGPAYDDVCVVWFLVLGAEDKGCVVEHPLHRAVCITLVSAVVPVVFLDRLDGFLARTGATEMSAIINTKSPTINRDWTDIDRQLLVAFVTKILFAASTGKLCLGRLATGVADHGLQHFGQMRLTEHVTRVGRVIF